MSDAHPRPVLASSLQHAIALLVSVARALLTHLHTTPAAAAPRTESRLATTQHWLTALAAALANDPYWRKPITYNFPRFPGRFPSLTADLRESIGLPPIPPATPEQKAAAHIRYMRRVFATHPTARIAHRLARRLGLTQAHPAWPHDLLQIEATPIAWASEKARGSTPPLPLGPRLGAPPPDPHNLEGNAPAGALPSRLCGSGGAAPSRGCGGETPGLPLWPP